MAAEASLTGYGEYIYPGYITSPYTLMIANILEGVLEGDIKRLIIEIPPRHSKSVHVSELLPAFALGHNPDLRLILASYASSLAVSFSRRVRNAIQSDKYGKVFPGTRLASDSRSAAMWDVAGHRGGMIAAGVGSGITGHGGNLIIIDDPVKDRAEAESATRRQAVWDWYTSTARTRLEPDGAIIICQTRWHHDDLAGRLLDGQDADDEYKDDWLEVKFPAIAVDEDDALGREIGAPLWPERYDLPALLSTKAEVGTRDWVALYQQDPSDEEGSIFPLNKWQYYDSDTFDFNSRYRTFQLWDTAYKEKEENDFSSCATWTRGPDGKCYLRDIRKWRVAFPELKRLFKSQYDMWNPDVSYIEDKASGISLFQEFQKTGVPVRLYTPVGSKIVRAHATTPYIENGMMLLPESADFLADFLQEHSQFPAGKHDDQVDTTTMAGLILARTSGTVTVVEIPEKVSAW
jgi:predicted phage terminase large subunit-like protein